LAPPPAARAKPPPTHLRPYRSSALLNDDAAALSHAPDDGVDHVRSRERLLRPLHHRRRNGGEQPAGGLWVAEQQAIGSGDALAVVDARRDVVGVALRAAGGMACRSIVD